VQVQALRWTDTLSDISTLRVKTDVNTQKKVSFVFCSHCVLRAIEEEKDEALNLFLTLLFVIEWIL
jgi:hypothetical protein